MVCLSGPFLYISYFEKKWAFYIIGLKDTLYAFLTLSKAGVFQKYIAFSSLWAGILILFSTCEVDCQSTN